jgi:flagellar basal-body rod modification protein FlgD
MPASIPGFNPSAAPVTPPTTADPTGSNALGKNDFMKLLLAQLANQDPTAPQDDQAFVAQLAQFAQLESSQGTNTRLDTLVSAQVASQQTQAVGFIGKSVDFRTDTLNLQAGLSTQSQVSLTGAASAVSVTVLDSTGKAVRTMKLGAQVAGAVNVTWDGNDDGGNRQPPGVYSLNVNATDAAGKAVGVSLQGNGLITGVDFDNGVPKLKVNGTIVTMSQVTSINERNTQ